MNAGASPRGRQTAIRTAADTALWVAVLGVVTLLLYGVRPTLDKAYVTLAYLLVVLGGSAHRGRVVGLVLSMLAFAAFNFVFIPPFGTLAVADPVDWLVLLAFLATSTVATQLLSRAQQETAVARELAVEVDRLATLGAESISAARADDALFSIAALVRDTLGASDGRIQVRDDRGAVVPVVSPDDRTATAPMSDLAAWVVHHGRPVAVRLDGTTYFPEDVTVGGNAVDMVGHEAGLRTVYLPLRVHDQTVGVLSLTAEAGLSLDPARRRMLTALTYYAALGAERVRLTREAEQAGALREADRMKDALLASVSHDLRTPLTTIRALADEIAGDGDDRAVVIVEEANRLTRLVGDLLDLSRLEGGGLRVSPELIAVDDVVGAAIQRLSGVPGNERLRVTLDDASPLLVGRFDFVHTLRVLVNLVENALKYAPSDSAVDLSVIREAADLVFEVADRGAGVPADERERIFMPFYRRQGAQPDVSGVGLGLSIARGLADAQGGSLTIRARDGGGSTFVLRVPAADLDAGMFEDAAPE
jgi:two-component system, OmpR family, sensor histidine kinase KdpD